MRKTVVSTPDAPAAIGPYSQAVATDGLVFCSGQIALDPSTGEFQAGSVTDQTKLAMQNLSAVLAAAGSGLDRIVKATIYVTDMGSFAEVNEAYGAFFSAEPPARATVGVASLPKGAEVEIECVALA